MLVTLFHSKRIIRSSYRANVRKGWDLADRDNVNSLIDSFISFGSLFRLFVLAGLCFSYIELVDDEPDSVAVEDMVAESEASSLSLVCFNLAAAAIAGFEGAFSYSDPITSSSC